MVSSKATSLALTKLSCLIPDYKTELRKIAETKNKDSLFIRFVDKFLNYIPVDDRSPDKLKLFCDFAEDAFAFFQNRAPGTRKILIKNNGKINSPALNIWLLNNNRPFIVDSLNCLLLKLNLQARFIFHPVILSKRDSKGDLQKITDLNGNSLEAESLVYIKILGEFDHEIIKNLQQEITSTIDQVEATHNIWNEALDEVSALAKIATKDQEASEFLEWLEKDNFTFLGVVDFDVASKRVVLERGAKEVWQKNNNEIKDIITLSQSENKSIILGKINRLSPVHRRNLVDYILVKKFDKEGRYISGVIILGLYGSAIYYQSIKNIPILRQKLFFVLKESGFHDGGHNYKKLKIIIESLPRDALIQIDELDLFCMCLHILSSMMSKKLKLFIQQDWSGAFANILIFLPRARLTPDIHNSINSYLSKYFNSVILTDYITEVAQNFSHLFVTFATKKKVNFLVSAIEADLEKISTNWSEAFYQELCNEFGEYEGGLNFKLFDKIFPIDYKHKFDAKTSLIDIKYLKLANLHNRPFFNLISTSLVDFELKIYSALNKITLSNILPSIENLGFKAIEEDSFDIIPNQEIKESWIYKFTLSSLIPIQGDFALLKANVEEALDKITAGALANDSLSKLIVLSGFNWQQIKLLKALTRYLHQTGFIYGKGYVQMILIKHNKYTEFLVNLFDAKFNPVQKSEEKIKNIINQAKKYLDSVTSSSEDKVLRSMLHLMEAMVRTNFYQYINGSIKDYLSFKFNSAKVPGLPLPLPYAEIFVYSNGFEGIHLRGGKVARGGIRWSDRVEDYRTEVLGLMKAQMTKNSVIVPVGSKGGFFVLPDELLTPNEFMDKVVNCYKNFLRGLLDITDNIVNGKVIHPQNTIIYDEQDPYLVVAADKGTATFSDYANSVSAEYSYWLADAFASGGSAGYDHKKMGITAKGAWISVMRHFQEIGIDVQKDPITVVGIGDMSGDVFGNGMLRSKAIKLVAAFNHKHIFIDPTPDPLLSFQERLRLFNLPKSQWSDYDTKLISKGGGIFERAAKTISISAELQNLIDIKDDELIPEDLIKALLKAKIDLIWNGGIGTYIKSSSESNLDIGDKANDLLRLDAKDIKAKAIAEGGNLGVSQQGRIEYSKIGGKINTDFIDNSAGVDCSDHEVNIKIVLNQALLAGKLSLEERNKLLASMTDQVEQLVLIDNYKQTQAITISQLSSALTVEIFSQLINILEEEKLLDRKVEFLPSQAELHKRAIAKEKMTRPELAVLLSYSKMSVYNELITAKLTEDKYFERSLIEYFPEVMRDKFREEILSHPLRDEIIRTVVTNKMVNQLSGPLISTVKRETGGALCDLARSYTIVCEIFNLNNLWEEVEQLTAEIDINIKIDMFTEIAKIIRRGIAWFVKHLEHPIDISETIQKFKEPARRISNVIGALLLGEAQMKYNDRIEKYIAGGIKKDLAISIATLDSLVSAFDIIHISQQTSAEDSGVAGLYFSTANRFYIDWLRKSCEKQMDDSYWNRLSIQSLKDDLYDKQRRLIITILNQSIGKINLDKWIDDNKKYTSIFTNFVENLKLQEEVNLNMIILANKRFEMFLRKLG